MKKLHINVKYINVILEEIRRAMDIQEPLIASIKTHEWGRSDDFIYSEYLKPCFNDLLPFEREAIMAITRTVINESIKSYYQLIEKGYTQYEDDPDYADYSHEDLVKQYDYMD